MIKNPDELTDILLDLNRYCFEKHIEFQVELIDDKQKSLINEIEKDGKKSIQIILGKFDDEDFFNELSNFFIRLKTTA